MKTVKKLPRLLIGATGSGAGKTTVTCGILKALQERGRKVLSFKCGPDYIDPMFHTEVLGIPSRNIDLFFTEQNTARYLMGRHGDFAELAVIEGVMGYYDGLAGTTVEASSFAVAESTETPAVLVADGRGRSVSLVAEIKGFLEYKRPNGILGVILNRVSPGMYTELKQMIEEQLPVKVYGFFPKMEHCVLESRHLGLVTAAELSDLQETLAVLGRQAEETIDLDGLIALSKTAEPLTYEEPKSETIEGIPAFDERHRCGTETEGEDGIAFVDAGKKEKPTPVRIGVARDKAFCFYYPDNLELLELLGLQLEFFSPLADRALPEGISGLLLGGGYPELYLSQLEENRSMKASVRQALERQMPCIAECGGFMYLQKTIADAEGTVFSMVGALEGNCFPTGQLGRFGYITMTAKEDNLLCAAGETLKGHEFHYWDSSLPGSGFHAQKPYRKRNWDCAVTGSNLYAGYPHIHFYSNRKAAQRFATACVQFGGMPADLYGDF